MDSNSGHNSNLYVACYIVLLATSCVLGYAMIGSDIQDLLRFYLAFFVLGLAALPLSKRILGRLRGEGGYVVGKIVGLFVCAYVQWFLSALSVLKFSRVVSLISIGIAALVIWGISLFLYKKREKNENGSEDASFAAVNTFTLESVFKWEFAVLIAFVFFTWLQAHRIPSTGTERLMNYGMMLSMDKTDYLPALDVWCAGEKLNYYYYGQYLWTFLSKISFTSVASAYSLGLSFIATVCLIFSYVIVSTLLGLNKEHSERVCVAGGVIGSLAVTCCGNVHYIIFYVLAPIIRDILQLKTEAAEYFFANSTRYIGHLPDVPEDKTITEFPWYSFTIGDLHAHVIDIISVLTIVSILICAAISISDKVDKKREDGSDTDSPAFELFMAQLKEFFGSPFPWMIGFVLGNIAMINYWDLPIYYVVAGSIIMFFFLRSTDRPLIALMMTAVSGIVIYALAYITKLPFELRFNKFNNGIRLCQYHSRLYQWIILWGLPSVVLILFVIFIIRTFDKDELSEDEQQAGAGLLEGISVPDLCVLLIGLCGIGLALVPEVVFVEDIYIKGNPRCNTMFKLTYQAFILSGLMMGYVTTRILAAKSKSEDVLNTLNMYRLKRAVALCLMVLGFTLMYAHTSSEMWYGDAKHWSYKGIDATRTTRSEMGQEEAVLDFIKDNIPGQEVILTAGAYSYTSEGVIPALSGHPTVMGWRTHEWLWHNDGDFVYAREQDIQAIYTSGNVDQIRSLIDKYDIKYIYVGPKEYEKYGFTDISVLESLGQVVYRDNEISSVMIKVE